MLTTTFSYNLRPTESPSVSPQSPTTGRSAKTNALNSLNRIVAPRLEKRSSSLDLQNVQLKGKVCYFYETRSGGSTKEFKIPFPIFTVKNNSVLQGSLTAQIKQSNPLSQLTCTRVAQAIKDNIKVYGRQANDSLSIRQKIDSVFYHTTKEPIHVHVSDLSQDKDGNYHFDFQVTLVFGPNAVSKESEIFWTLKLKNTILSEDMLIESDASNRNGKIDRVQPFHAWEKKVCWYKEYKEFTITPECDSFDEEVNNKESDEDLQLEDAYEVPSPSTDRQFIPITRNHQRRKLVLSDDSLPFTIPLSTVALPVEEQVTPKSLLSTAQANAIKITEYIPNILASLQAQAEIEQQKNAQIAQLQQQLADQKQEQQVLKDQLEQELKNAQQECNTLQAREQKLAAEVARLQDALTAAKSQERTPSPPPNMGNLQEQLTQANDAYKGARRSYEEKKRQLAIAEKAIKDYQTNLDQANQAVTQLKEGKTQLEEKLRQAEIKQRTSTHNTAHLKRASRTHLHMKAIFGSVKDHREVAEKLLAQEKNRTTELTTELQRQEKDLEAACKSLVNSKRNEAHLESQLKSTEQKLKEEQAGAFVLKRRLEEVEQQVTEKEKEKEQEVNRQKRLRKDTELESQQQIQGLELKLQEKAKTEAKLKAELEAMRTKWAQLQGLFSNGTSHSN